MGSGMEGRLSNKLTESTNAYNKVKSSTNLSYKNSSIDGLYESAQAQVKETADEVDRTVGDTSSSGSGKTAQIIATSLAALTTLAPVATTIISSTKGSKSAQTVDNATALTTALTNYTDVKGSDKNRKALGKAIDGAKNEMQSLVEKRSNLVAQKTEKENQLKLDSKDGANATLDKLKTALSDLEKSKTDENAKVASYESQITVIEEFIAGKAQEQAQITNEKGEKVAAKVEVEKLSDKEKSQLADLGVKIQENQDEATQIKTELNNAKNEKSQKLEPALANATAEKNTADTAVKGTKTSIESCDREIDRLEGLAKKPAKDSSGKVIAKDSKEQYKSQIDAKKNEKSKLKDKLKEDEKTLKEKEKAEKDAKTKLEQNASKIAILENKITVNGKSLTELQQAKSASEEKVKGFDVQIANANTQIAEQEALIEDIKTVTTTKAEEKKQNEAGKAEAQDNAGKADDAKAKVKAGETTYKSKLAKQYSKEIAELDTQIKDIDKRYSELDALVKKGNTAIYGNEEGTVAETSDTQKGDEADKSEKATKATTPKADDNVSDNNDNDTSMKAMFAWSNADSTPKNGDKTTYNNEEYTFKNGKWTDKDGNEYKDLWGKPDLSSKSKPFSLIVEDNK